MTAKTKNLLQDLFTSFRNGLFAGRAKAPKAFLDQLGLDYQQLEIGFNSGQFHHGKSEEFRKPYVEAGILKLSDAPVNDPSKIPYSVFGKESIVFPLKDELGMIVNYYCYRFKIATPKGEYLNENGVYPCIPNERTTRVFLCQDEMQTATLIQSGLLDNRDAVISLREGKLVEPILNALERLNELNHVFILGSFDESISAALNDQSYYQVHSVDLPENHTLNDMWLKYGSEAIEEVIANSVQEEEQLPFEDKLEVISQTEFQYQGTEMTYQIAGEIPENRTLLDMHFTIRKGLDANVFRGKLDLLDSNKVKEVLFNWSDGKEVNYARMLVEIDFITQELEKLRLLQIQGEKLTSKGFSTKADKQAKKLLKSENLFSELNRLIGESGIVGEEAIRLMLFMIASSYKFNYNLHAVVQTERTETGAELIDKVAKLIPETDKYEIDLTTSRTFRYYGNFVLNGKCLVIPDYYGVTSSKAIKDLKRLQAKGVIVNDAPKKTKDGVLTTTKQEVKGHTSSIGACGATKKFFENQPRTVLVGMDSSPNQIEKLMEYDCILMSGMVDTQKEEATREVLHYLIRNIHPLEVVNKYASTLMLPSNLPNARMLTMQLHNFVAITTLFKQHQRRKDKFGRVVTEKNDIRVATDLFLDAIMVNIDELDSTTRGFFDRLKTLMISQPNGKDSKMSSLEIRQALQMPKSTVNRMLRTLVEYEYVKKKGHKNTGFEYVITNWNELSNVKKAIEKKLSELNDPS